MALYGYVFCITYSIKPLPHSALVWDTAPLNDHRLEKMLLACTVVSLQLELSVRVRSPWPGLFGRTVCLCEGVFIFIFSKTCLWSKIYILSWRMLVLQINSEGALISWQICFRFHFFLPRVLRRCLAYHVALVMLLLHGQSSLVRGQLSTCFEGSCGAR